MNNPLLSRGGLLVLSTVVACSAGLSSDLFRHSIGGYVFDMSSRSIRPLVGVPGSAYLGKAVVQDVDFASISPDGNAVIVRQKADVRLIRNFQSTFSSEQTLACADYVAWSKQIVVLYCSASHDLQRIPLSTNPSSFSSNQHLTGSFHAFAVDPTGEVVAAVKPDGVYIIAGDQQPRRLVSLDGNQAHVAFGSTTLYIASEGKIFVTSKPFDNLLEQQALPAGLVPDEISVSGSFLLLADARTSGIKLYHLNSWEVTDLVVDYVSASFERLSQSVVLLRPSDSAIRAINVINFKEQLPKVYFIPSIPETL